jgi:ketosteroid isomerase-like protein
MTSDRFSWGPGEVKPVEPENSFHDNDFVARLQAVTNAHDVDAVVDCFTPDYENITPAHPARGFTGRDQVRSNWEQIFAFVPDITARVLAHAGDDREIWSEWEMTGTRRDGSRHHVCGVIVFSIRDGRACAARFFLEPVDEAAVHIDDVVAAQVHADR